MTTEANRAEERERDPHRSPELRRASKPDKHCDAICKDLAKRLSIPFDDWEEPERVFTRAVTEAAARAAQRLGVRLRDRAWMNVALEREFLVVCAVAVRHEAICRALEGYAMQHAQKVQEIALAVREELDPTWEGPTGRDAAHDYLQPSHWARRFEADDLPEAAADVRLSILVAGLRQQEEALRQAGRDYRAELQHVCSGRQRQRAT